MIFGIKEKIHHFDPYNVLLAIATNIPVLLMIGFVVQGYKCSHLQCTRLSQPPVGVPMYNHQRALFLTFVCFFWTSVPINPFSIVSLNHYQIINHF